MTITRLHSLLFCTLAVLAFSACGGDDDDAEEPVDVEQTADSDNNDDSDGDDSDGDAATDEEETSDDDATTAVTSDFAKGADVSWLTEMEAAGYKFYDSDGNATECMALLKSLGVDAIRLRVWVDPDDGWCGKEDVVAKAVRADALGMRLMIDFHYSDSWADPSRQTIPSAWTSYDLEAMKTAVADHTTDVLQAIKDEGATVDWVQVGNETRVGMLWDVGLVADDNFSSFSELVTAGYDAVKTVFPSAKVIVHLDNGYDLSLYKWMFDGLAAEDTKWDVIGMSIYPESGTWSTRIASCLSNMSTLAARYDCEVMMCEIGMSWDATFAEEAMRQMVEGAKQVEACLGVFYWEPECYNGWNGYTKGAFDNTGKPTSTLNVFGEE